MPFLVKPAFFHAVLTGHADMLELICKREDLGGFRHPYNVFKLAMHQGHVQVVRFLERHHFRCKLCPMWMAADRGHLPLVYFFHRSTTTRSAGAMNAAASRGHLAVVEFLHVNFRGRRSDNTMRCAAAGGHLLTVQFLFDNGYDPRYALEAAVQVGHTDVAAYLERVSNPQSPCDTTFATSTTESNVVDA
ncbi:Aste57867_2441 [Aphanomyces stellatus]|uniref:Aste57867_2441 protein n=1 Tax=Aphanomyces stellatus TaxID=120398 RepID=A0A485K913_9STRA|nr:hypothetical protein As57867_002435 [Aphanomyces stellatus]VFT79642.1 Aste57867_2441 [Aphanomyces stellatus]